jgi:uncharacterized membrane protein
VSTVLALCSSITWGVSDYVGGVTTRAAPAVTVVLWAHIIGLAVVLVGATAFGGTLDPASIGWAMGAGAAGALGLVALYHGLATQRMAAVAPTAAVVGAAIPVITGIALGERPTFPSVFGIVIALPALWLVSLTSEGRHSLEVGPGLLAGGGFGAFFVLLAQVPETGSLWPLVPARIASATLLTVIVVLTGKPLTVGRAAVPGVGVAGATDVLANMFYLAAVQRGLLSTVAVLSSLYPAVTVVLARLRGESLSSMQWTGVTLSIISLALIAT